MKFSKGGQGSGRYPKGSQQWTSKPSRFGTPFTSSEITSPDGTKFTFDFFQNGKLANVKGERGKFEFENESLDYHNGQSDFRAVAWLPNAEGTQAIAVAQIHYSLYEGTVHINYVETNPEAQGNGLATTLYALVSLANPEAPIEDGYQTDDGAKWRNSKAVADQMAWATSLTLPKQVQKGGEGSGIKGHTTDEPPRQAFTERFPMLADRNQVSADRNQVSADRNGDTNPTARFISDSAADFTRAGGKLFEVHAGTLGYFDSEALFNLQKEVDEEARSQGFKSLEHYAHPDSKTEPEKYQQWSGLYMMRAALSPFQVRNNEDDYRGAVRIFIARDAKGKIAGAAQIQNNGYIHYIGSNNKVDGAGTALISNIIQNAADNDLGVAFEPLSTAVKFWEMAGFKPKSEGSDVYVMRSAEVKQVASQLKTMKVTKGGEGSGRFPKGSGRPPIGNFQLTETELVQVNQASEKARQYAYEEGLETEARLSLIHNAIAVEVAKILGADEPAHQKINLSNPPQLFRGCSLEGAKSLLEPLTTYGGGGAELLGTGIYFTTDKAWAQHYAQGDNNALVEAWVMPNSQTISWQDAKNLPYPEDDYSEEAESGLEQITQNPAIYALACGYKAIDASEITEHQAIVVLDRSLLSINITEPFQKGGQGSGRFPKGTTQSPEWTRQQVYWAEGRAFRNDRNINDEQATDLATRIIGQKVYIVPKDLGTSSSNPEATIVGRARWLTLSKDIADGTKAGTTIPVVFRNEQYPLKLTTLLHEVAHLVCDQDGVRKDHNLEFVKAFVGLLQEHTPDGTPQVRNFLFALKNEINPEDHDDTPENLALDAEWVDQLLTSGEIAKGGQGSGRYPKGSGKEQESDQQAKAIKLMGYGYRDEQSQAEIERNKAKREQSLAEIASRLSPKTQNELCKRMFQEWTEGAKFVAGKTTIFVGKSGVWASAEAVEAEQLKGFRELSPEESIALLSKEGVLDIAQQWEGQGEEVAPMIRAAKELFGRPDTARVRNLVDEGGGWHTPYTTSTYKDVMKSMYDQTQKEFAEAGITSVTLYRGISLTNTPSWLKGSKVGETVEIKTPPITSTATDAGSTYFFAHGGGFYQPKPLENAVIVSATFPVSRVLSFSLSGMGDASEKEVVFIGGKDQWTLDTWREHTWEGWEVHEDDQ